MIFQDTENVPMHTLNCQGRLLSLEQPVVMGILNTTPDSFYAGSRVPKMDALLAQAEQMLAEGARILDVGGASSRPGAEVVSVAEELKRVVPAVETLSKQCPEALISVDTYRAPVAEAALQAGAHLINDISGGRMDPALLEVVAAAKVPYILMHMQGTPETMQANPRYDALLTDVLDYFVERLRILQQYGIEDIVLDVGFGFGKTLDHNYELLAHLSEFRVLQRPMLAGVSRKSMIWKALGDCPADALNGTTALHMVALQQGAAILRVHDVRPAIETIQLYQRLRRHSNNQTTLSSIHTTA